MKINDLERWCKKNEKYSYEYFIGENNNRIFVNLHTNRCTIFADEEKKLKTHLKRNKWKIQYIYCSGIDIAYAIVRDH